MTGLLDGISSGIAAAATAEHLLMLMVGCLAGTIIGILPGLGPITAITLMIPITQGLDPAGGMIMMAGVYYGAVFGGSTTSILINAPGIAGTVATAFDGYPMARAGQAGKALAIAAYSSFAGATIGALLLLLCAAPLAQAAASFQSAEYFLVMLLGLSCIAAFTADGRFGAALVAVGIGLLLAAVGTDQGSGIPRFTFGRADLIDGISFLLLAMATFAFAEALMLASRGDRDSKLPVARFRDLVVSRPEVRELAPVVGRSSIVGFLLGTLPGAGATIASLVAWSTERGLADPAARRQFGKGSRRGLAAPEAANNAACTGSFVPLLTLGIPGSATTAVLLGVMLGWGIQPGPLLLDREPALFWGVITSMYLGNLVLLILNLPLIPVLARLLALPRTVLVPLVLALSMVGVYLVSFNPFDLYLIVVLGTGAWLLRLVGIPMAPLLLAFILGGLLEENLRRALLVSGGSGSFLWARPTTVVLLVLVGLVLLFPAGQAIWKRRAAR